jgi:uncharacterized protein
VNDYANVLTVDAKSALEEVLSSFAASTTNEIAVVTIPGLDGDTIEHYAVTLFEKWKIGNAKNDNGVLLLVAVDDHKLRIEVGYGLEGALPDILAKNIIETQITPAFKDGNYQLGILQGVYAIAEATKGEYIAARDTTKSFPQMSSGVFEFLFFIGFFVLQYLSAIFARSKSWWAGGLTGGLIGGALTLFGVFGVTLVVGSIITAVLILFGLLFDFIVSNAYTNGRSTGGGIPWWAGGGTRSSSGGSFGGFGGGSSGGGGASGSW